MRVEAHGGKVHVMPEWVEVDPGEVFFAADNLTEYEINRTAYTDMDLSPLRSDFEESMAVKLDPREVEQLIDRLRSAVSTLCDIAERGGR